MKWTALICCIFFPFICLSQILTTVAGSFSSGFSGDGGLATSAKLNDPLSVWVDTAGNLYITDYNNKRVRKVNPSGTISTIAGGGSSYADSILATSAHLDLGTITTDLSGNLYLVDGARIRRVDAVTGIITNVVGNGTAGFGGDGGQAFLAQINSPHGLCVDGCGNIYIGDYGNQRVRKVDAVGIISTYAGNGTTGYSGDSGLAINAQLNLPCGLIVDTIGNVYVPEEYNFRIRKIDTSGIITTYAGNGASGFSGDGGLAVNAQFNEPSYVCIDRYGNLYVADFHNSRIRKITASGYITTYAGGGSSSASGILATNASFNDVWGVYVDAYNNIYIPDRFNNRICKVSDTSTTAFKTLSNQCSPSGIWSLQGLGKDMVNVYPNPANNFLTVSSIKPITDIVIANLLGQTVFSNFYNNRDVHLDVSYLAAGLYLIKINGGEIRRFVKQ